MLLKDDLNHCGQLFNVFFVFFSWFEKNKLAREGPRSEPIDKASTFFL